MNHNFSNKGQILPHIPITRFLVEHNLFNIASPSGSPLTPSFRHGSQLKFAVVVKKNMYTTTNKFRISTHIQFLYFHTLVLVLMLLFFQEVSRNASIKISICKLWILEVGQNTHFDTCHFTVKAAAELLLELFEMLLTTSG